MGQHHPKIGAGQPPALRLDPDDRQRRAGVGVEEEQPRRDDDDRHDHRRNQDRHDQAAIGHFGPRQAKGGQRAQNGGKNGGPKADDDRILRGLDPGRGFPGLCPPGTVAHAIRCRHAQRQQRVVPAQRIALGIQCQHLRGKGEIGLGVEGQRNDDKNRCDQEDEDQHADHAESIAPDAFQRGGIGGYGHGAFPQPSFRLSMPISRSYSQ